MRSRRGSVSEETETKRRGDEMTLTFGDDAICRFCHGTGAGGTCRRCGGSGIESRKARIEAGRELRDAGMAKVEERDPEWKVEARAWIEARDRGWEFVADDLTDEIGFPAAKSAVGPVFAWAARSGLIERAGVRSSGIRTSHASIVQVWRRR